MSHHLQYNIVERLFNSFLLLLLQNCEYHAKAMVAFWRGSRWFGIEKLVHLEREVARKQSPVCVRGEIFFFRVLVCSTSARRNLWTHFPELLFFVCPFLWSCVLHIVSVCPQSSTRVVGIVCRIEMCVRQ